MMNDMDQVHVMLYTTTSCPYCWETRQHLTDRGVAFEELNIDESSLAASYLRQIVGDLVVPVTVVTNPAQAESVIVGFDRQKLDTALGLK